MGWWPFSRGLRGLGEPPDYYREGLKLTGERKYHEALTSFRLALRQRPEDAEIMEQMAVVYTRIGIPEEAVKFYRLAIETGNHSPGAHYGLGFLLLRRGDEEGARWQLERFLSDPPRGEEASAHVEHARKTLLRLSGEEGDEDRKDGEGPEPE